MNPNHQMHLEGLIFSLKMTNFTLKSSCKCFQVGLETYFLPQTPPNGGSWGPSHLFSQSSNCQINYWRTDCKKGWSCGFGPVQHRAFQLTIKTKHPFPSSLSPSPHSSIHRPISPFVLPLFSAAPRHQVDGLLQFVPQFMLATVTVPVQCRQDLPSQRRHVRNYTENTPKNYYWILHSTWYKHQRHKTAFLVRSLPLCKCVYVLSLKPCATDNRDIWKSLTFTNSVKVKTMPPSTHLFLVLVDVEVQLTERAQCVKLVAMETGLLHQVGVHVLIADAWHLCNIPVVPATKKHRYA